MRRRAFLTTVWAGLLAGCNSQNEETGSPTTETTYGYGGATAATETAVKTGDAVTAGTTTAVSTTATTTTNATATVTASADDEYGEQRYGTHGYGGEL